VLCDVVWNNKKKKKKKKRKKEKRENPKEAVQKKCTNVLLFSNQAAVSESL
jgi:hypothetical protein